MVYSFATPAADAVLSARLAGRSRGCDAVTILVPRRIITPLHVMLPHHHMFRFMYIVDHLFCCLYSGWFVSVVMLISTLGNNIPTRPCSLFCCVGYPRVILVGWQVDSLDLPHPNLPPLELLQPSPRYSICRGWRRLGSICGSLRRWGHHPPGSNCVGGSKPFVARSSASVGVMTRETLHLLKVREME